MFEGILGNILGGALGGDRQQSAKRKAAADMAAQQREYIRQMQYEQRRAQMGRQQAFTKQFGFTPEAKEKPKDFIDVEAVTIEEEECNLLESLLESAKNESI